MSVIVALLLDYSFETARFQHVKNKASDNAFPIYRFPPSSAPLSSEASVWEHCKDKHYSWNNKILWKIFFHNRPNIPNMNFLKPRCTERLRVSISLSDLPLDLFVTIYITIICECHVRLLGLFNHLPKAETKNTTDTDAGTAKPALYQLYTEC